MRMIAAVLLSLAMLGVAANAAPPRRPVPATPRDWGAVVTRAPSGAFVMGNPQAKVRLVEYASLTCSHCAAFAAEGLPALRAGYVKRGEVSVEFRHAVRDRADLAASLIARCAGPRGYFATMERIFAAQEQWLPRAAAVPDAGGDPDSPATREQALIDTATGAGLPIIATISPQIATNCLRNPAEQKVLGGMADEAWGVRKIGGTPTFLINDRKVEGTIWGQLEPQIAAALR